MPLESRRRASSIVKNIRRNTYKKFTAEEKIRIVLEGMKGEESIAELCRKVGINPNTYYNWSKAFLESGKRQLSGDTKREANTDEVSELRKDNSQLKHLVAELSLENRVLKKTLNGLE